MRHHNLQRRHLGVREGRPGQWEEALGLLWEMASKGVERDTITYNAAVSACEEAGSVCHCNALYAEAFADGLLDHRLDSFSIEMDLPSHSRWSLLDQ